MFKIEYEIKLNESGRPYVDLPPEYENNPEDRFFAIEMTRYILQDTMSRKTPELNTETVEKMDSNERLLGQIADEMAEILWEMMRSNATISMMMDVPYHVLVNSIEERDSLPNENILVDDKLYCRVEGLKVGIQQYDEETFSPYIDVYELQDGITNENWVKL